MKIADVMAGTGLRCAESGASQWDAAGISCDTRTLRPGELFFAVAPEFARTALEAGAAAVVLDESVRAEAAGVPSGKVIWSPSIRRDMALAAANFYGRPARRMTMLGVTGTNGKTTTTLLAEAMLKAAGESVGVIGTISYRYGGREIPAPNTTPGSIPLQKLLADMAGSGVTSVVMEVSSHALDQERTFGIPFSCAAFTNLTRDHLDYHGDMETYFRAKRRLFAEQCAGVCTLNTDDPYGRRLHAELVREGRVTFGFSSRTQEAELFVTDLEQDIDGISATLHAPSGNAHFHSHLVGLHNVENMLAAAGLLLGAGFELSDVVRGIEALEKVPGRLERVPGTKAVFVDYAHTDDALTHVLNALRPLTKGRLICVFGCGGDRDHGKRPLMGEAVARGADAAVVTNDNPRSEKPEAIAAAILEGVERGGMRRTEASELAAGGCGCAVMLHRRDAIELAIRSARPGDVVLVAGKGHENYQLVGGQRLAFDDREAAAEILRSAEGGH